MLKEQEPSTLLDGRAAILVHCSEGNGDASTSLASLANVAHKVEACRELTHWYSKGREMAATTAKCERGRHVVCIV